VGKARETESGIFRSLGSRVEVLQKAAQEITGNSLSIEHKRGKRRKEDSYSGPKWWENEGQNNARRVFTSLMTQETEGGAGGVAVLNRKKESLNSKGGGKGSDRF